MPARPLVLSPDHAVFTDGVLIPVRYLINGASIAQIPTERVGYWHVELERHDVLLAEGLPCESYLDTGKSRRFRQWRRCGPGASRLRPRHLGRARLRPAVLKGAMLRRVRTRLIARLHGLGHVVTCSPDLHVLATGWRSRRNGLTRIAAWRCRAAPAADPAEPRGPPADFDPASDDTRSLGLALCRLQLDGTPIALDDPRLDAGWLSAEPDLRWTEGAGEIDVAGVDLVELRMGGWLRYLETIEPPQCDVARSIAC